MKRWIGINVRSNNQGILNAVEASLLHPSDSRLCPISANSVNRTFEPITGCGVVNASLFFNEGSERNDFETTLRKVTGFLHAALHGSFLELATTYHDELDSKGCPMFPDEIEYREVVE